MTKGGQFVLIAFLTLLSSIAFTVGTFWLFRNHTAELAAHVDAALSTHIPSARSLDLRSVLASERVSSLADNMFWISLVQALGSLFSLIILVPTLLYTRRAARAAGAAAEEAKIANADTQELIAHSRNTTKVELRSYVTLDSVEIDKTEDRCTIVFEFKNFGRSPAHNFKVKTAWGLQNDLTSSEVPENDQHESIPGALMPDQVKKISIFEKTDKMLSTVADGTANLLIKVSYSSSSPYYDEDELRDLRMYVDKAYLARRTANLMS